MKNYLYYVHLLKNLKVIENLISYVLRFNFNGKILLSQLFYKKNDTDRNVLH